MRTDTVIAIRSDRQGSARLVVIALSVIALIATVLVPGVARAAPDVAVTAATGGTGISLDTTSNAGTGTYTALGDIVITENAAADFPTQTATTLVFSAPTSFEFQAATGTATAATADVSVDSIAVTSTNVTVTITVSATAVIDTLTISGLTVRPTNQTPTTGEILNTSGTATIVGVGASTNFGTLSSVPGALANFGVLAEGGGAIATQKAEQSFNLQFTARDQFNNTLNSVNSATAFTGTVAVSSNITGSAGLGTSAAFVNGVLAAHAVTLTATSNNAATITVNNTTPAVESTSAAFTVSPGFTSVTPAALGQGVTTQNLTVNGAGFDSTAAATFSGTGITVNSTTTVSATELTVNVTIDGAAATGTRDLTITNGDTTSVTAAAAFTINAVPTVTSLAPNSVAQGVSNKDVVVTGTGFASGAVASFSGAGITVVSTTFDSATQLTVRVSIDGAAATGSRDLTVTNTDKGAVTSSAALTVNAAPAFSSATTNTAGTNITITFTKDVADPAGLHGQFTFTVNAGTARNFTQAQAGTSSQVVLTIDGAAITSGNTVKVSYTAGSLVGTDGGVVVSFTDQTVTNAVPAPTVTDPPTTTTTDDVQQGGKVALLADSASVSTTQPLDVSVTTPQGGTIEIVADTDTQPDSQTGFSMLGLVVDITAPDATPEAPLSIPFTLHPSLFDGMDPLMVVPMRNGTAMSGCTGPEGVASPDPCVASKTIDTDGNLVIHVLTSAASTWTLGEGESCQASTFSDVTQGATHTASIDCALQVGIVDGFGDGSYGPDATIRRDQMASLIVRTLEAAGDTLPKAAHTFTDITGNVHADAIGRLAAAGIVSGTTTGTFDPNGFVQRDQLASVLIQAAKWANVDTTVTTGSGFVDIDGNVHHDAIAVAVKLGLTFGVTDGIYNPYGLVRRDQMASFLIRQYELL